MASAARGPRVFVGLAILAIGVVFLLENLTDWEIPWGGWWPVILIVMGTWNLVRKDSSRVGAIALIALGVFFLLDTQDVWEYSIGDIWRFWPVVLILVGAKMLFSRNWKRSRPAPQQRIDDRYSPGELNVTSVFGSSQRRVNDQALAGGQVISVFASTEINLRDAALADGEATLDITVIFGSAQIRVPDNWTIDVQINDLLGSIEDERDRSPSRVPVGRLTLTGICLFGGIDLDS